jgi:hypothetical protein
MAAGPPECPPGGGGGGGGAFAGTASARVTEATDTEEYSSGPRKARGWPGAFPEAGQGQARLPVLSVGRADGVSVAHLI